LMVFIYGYFVMPNLKFLIKFLFNYTIFILILGSYMFVVGLT
jgi:hypothetical protein